MKASLGIQTIEENDDPICRKITQCAKDGICLNKSIREIIDDMIRAIPEVERMKPDIKGFMFLPNDSGEIVERVYSEKQHYREREDIYCLQDWRMNAS